MSGKAYVMKMPDNSDFEDIQVGSLYCPTDIMKCMSEYVSEVFPKAGWVESNYWNNWRLLLCAAGCAFACWGHFMVKFPDGRILLGLCVLSYFILSGFVTALDYFVLESAVVSLFPPEGSALPDKRIFLDIDMDRFDSMMTLTVRDLDGKKVEDRKCASNYFTGDGYIVCENVFRDFGLLMQKYYGEKSLQFKAPETMKTK